MRGGGGDNTPEWQLLNKLDIFNQEQSYLSSWFKKGYLYHKKQRLWLSNAIENQISVYVLQLNFKTFYDYFSKDISTFNINCNWAMGELNKYNISKFQKK